MSPSSRLCTLVDHLQPSSQEDPDKHGESHENEYRNAGSDQVAVQWGTGPSPEHLQCSRITPEVGAEVVGASLHEASSNPGLVAAVDAALLEHKVLVFRGETRMDTEKQLALIRALNKHWGLRAASHQQQQSYQDGAFVIRMLPSKPGTNATVWPVESQGKVSTRADAITVEGPVNPAGQLASGKTSLVHRWPYHTLLARRPPRALGGRMGRFALTYGGTGNWTRHGQEMTQATNVWHSDDNYVLEPPWVTALRAVRVPPCGGDTLFADMALAAGDLSEETLTLLRSLAAIADWRPVFPHYAPGSDAYQQLCRLYPLVAHPLIRTHPVTGEEVLYCNSIYTIGLRHWTLDNGVNDGSQASQLGTVPEYADQILHELFTLPGVPEYQCRVRWQGLGDFLIWDNRRLQHYAVADYKTEARHMEHCASLGTTPFLTLDHSYTSTSRSPARVFSQLLPVGAEL